MCSNINDIDRILAQYYMMHKTTNYQNSEGIGKFKLFCEDNGIDDDTIADEFDVVDGDSILVEFDDKFPFFDNVKSEQKNKRIHEILTHIYYNNTCPLVTYTFVPSDAISIDDYQDNLMPKYKIKLSSDCFTELLSFLPIIDIFKILYGNIVKTKIYSLYGDILKTKTSSVQCWNIYIKLTDNIKNVMHFWNKIDFRRIFAFIYGEYLQKKFKYLENPEMFVNQEWIGHISDYETVRNTNNGSYLNCIDIDLTNTNLQNILSYDRIENSKNETLVVKHTMDRTQTYFKLNDLKFKNKQDSKDYTFGEIRCKNMLPFGVCGDQVSDNRKLYPMHLWSAAGTMGYFDDGFWILFCLLHNSNCLRRTDEIVIRFSVAFWIGHYYHYYINGNSIDC